MDDKKTIVKYNNDLNEIQFGSFTAKELDIFITVFNDIRLSLGDEDVKFNSEKRIMREYTFEELRNILQMPAHVYPRALFRKYLLSLGKKLNSLRCFFDTPTESGYISIFPTFAPLKQKDVLVIEVNPTYLYLMTNTTIHYTKFELDEYRSLSLVASKALYHKIKQYKMTGMVFFADIDEFRQMMALSDTSRSRDITTRIVEPAVLELQKIIPSLRLDIEKGGKSHQITGFSLSFKPTKAKPKYLKEVKRSGKENNSDNFNFHTA